MTKEYRVVKYKENMIKAILFGQAKVSPKRFSKFLNDFSDDGWSAVSIDRSIDSVFLLFSRENYVVVLEREAPKGTKKIKPKSIDIPQEITDSEL